jgi:hypothetical protein
MHFKERDYQHRRHLEQQDEADKVGAGRKIRA